jgi:hypothetical protein
MTDTQAGLIVSKTDVHLEPLNLAHCYPTSQPGDLQLNLAPTYVSSPLLSFSKTAFDIQVTGSFSSQSVGNTSYMAFITKHLHTVEQEKFCGPTFNNVSPFVNGEMVIQALNESNTLLIPFIIDPFSALGPIANRFLFGLQPDPDPDHSTSRVLLLNMPTKIPCLLPCLPACHTMQINIGHKICPTSHLAIVRQTGFDRPSAPTLI